MITIAENFLRWLFTPSHLLREQRLRQQFINDHKDELGEAYAAEFWDKYN